jgi:hypothetical protein
MCGLVESLLNRFPNLLRERFTSLRINLYNHSTLDVTINGCGAAIKLSQGEVLRTGSLSKAIEPQATVTVRASYELSSPLAAPPINLTNPRLAKPRLGLTLIAAPQLLLNVTSYIVMAIQSVLLSFNRCFRRVNNDCASQTEGDYCWTPSDSDFANHSLSFAIWQVSAVQTRQKANAGLAKAGCARGPDAR